MSRSIAALSVTLFCANASAKGEGGGISGFCFGQDSLFATVARFPEDAPDLVVVSTNFGLLVSRDGGETFGWVCPDVYGAQIAGNFTLFALPGVAVLPDGTIFVLTGGLGYWISSEEACRFESAPDDNLRAAAVVSVAARGVLPETVFAAASWPGRGPFGIFRSEDDGASFAATELTSDGRLRFGSVFLTPGAERVYATTRTEDGINALWRSDDRGESWVPGDGELAALSAVVAGGRAGNVEEVYVEAVEAITGACEFDVALLGSSDGGDTFELVRQKEEILVGSIVQGDEGLWIGWKDSGVEVSEDGAAFAPLDGSPAPIGCLQPARDGDAIVCPLGAVPELVTIHRAASGEFESFIALDDITGPLDCPADSPVGRSCPERWAEFAAYWGLGPPIDRDGGVPGVDGGPVPGRDAGPGEDAGDVVVPPSQDGCSCRAAGTGGPGGAGLLAGLLLSVLRSRGSARRTRRSPPP